MGVPAPRLRRLRRSEQQARPPPATSRRDAEPPQCGDRARQPGLELERLAQVSDRALLVAEPNLRLGAIVPRGDVRRIVFERLVVVGKPALVVAGPEPQHSAIAAPA